MQHLICIGIFLALLGGKKISRSLPRSQLDNLCLFNSRNKRQKRPRMQKQNPSNHAIYLCMLCFFFFCGGCGEGEFTCMSALPRRSAMVMKLGFCMTCCMVEMYCWGSNCGTPSSPAPCTLFVSCSAIWLNTGSRAICSAISFIDGSFNSTKSNKYDWFSKYIIIFI